MMASLKEIKNPHGQTRWRVNFELGAVRTHKDYRSWQDACRHLYQAEVERFGDMSPDEREKSRDWTLKKLIQFFIGKKMQQIEEGTLRVSSLNTIIRGLLSIDDALQNKMALKIKPSEMAHLPVLTTKYLDSAYRIMCRLRGKVYFSLFTVKKQSVKPVPVFDNIDDIVAAASKREKIAILLAARCGLRRAEVMALEYADLTGKYISVTRQLTAAGIVSGLKRDTQRLMPIPKDLKPLLDKSKAGTHTPIIARHRDGKRLSLNYTNSGALKALLIKFGVKTFHNLRHHASLTALEKGNELDTVSRLLGHKDITTTVRVYGCFAKRVLSIKY